MKNDRSWTEINLDNYYNNISELKRFIPQNVNFMQIVKADAYGHGAYEIANAALKAGAVALGVANVQEAILLRYQEVSVPILILSPSHPSEISEILEYDLTPSVSSIDFARELSAAFGKANKQANIHLNIDTGIRRSGVSINRAEKFYKQISKLPNLKIEGIFSHFASAETDQNYTKYQQNLFHKFLIKIDNKPRWIHLANSSGLLVTRFKHENLVRLGLLSFGVYANEKQKSKVNLKPVMTFKTRISQIKTVKAGESIGYNRTYISPIDSRFAILPVGYADGYDFMLSEKGIVLIRKELCPVIGRISMDMTAIDLTSCPDISIGDEVILVGSSSNQLRVEHLASLYNGSAYELLCQIGRRARRYYLESGKITSSSPLLRREFVSTDYSDDKLNRIIETAIEQRLQSKQIAGLIYGDILQHFFSERDRKINYRRNFQHKIEFIPHTEVKSLSKQKKQDLQENYYRVETTLKFRKKLSDNHFLVVCANSEEALEKYFKQANTEYRWLLDNRLDLSPEFFKITSLKINNIVLNIQIKYVKGCLEVYCHNPKLDTLLNQEVEFIISTHTYYPKNAHQLSIYISEPTQGVSITFIHNGLLKSLDAVPIFSGRSKFPQIKKLENGVLISSLKDEWVFPTSGVVFAY